MNTSKESSDLIGQRLQRIEKINKLKELGIDPYPAKTFSTNTILEVVENFAGFEGKEVVLAGRITAWRGHGKLIFADLTGQDSKIQLYIKEDNLEVKNIEGGRSLAFSELNLLDVYDFVEVYGEMTKTQRGEISILVNHIRILTKVLRPLPSLLEDKEERFRRRYVDMAVHADVRHRIERRALFWQAHREFLNQKGFFEVNVPVLEHVPGGGDAVPFTTHMNALDEDFFLRISHELPLKRLIGGGFEKVYDIGARFRNEGLSDEHLPEHVAMEFYWAYADWKDGMKFIQEMFSYIISQVYGEKKIFNIRGFEVDFSKEWGTIDFNQIMQEKFGVKDIYKITIEEVKELLHKNNIEFDRSVNIARGVDALWKRIRKDIAGPTFLINHPKYLSPLQKPSVEDPNMVERCQIIIAGSELGNGWTELNDAIDQYDRFIEQQRLRDSGDAEAQWLDIDYVEMLEYGMPPTFGWGHSERVFWFLEDVTAREGVPFPQLRMDFDNVTKEIYPDAFLNNSKATKNPEADIPLINLEVLPKLSLAIINEEVRTKFSGIKFGYIVLENIKVDKQNDDLDNLKDSINSKVKLKFSQADKLKESKNIEGFRQIYKSFGVDPNSRLNSAEALLRRVIKGKGLYNINNVVDTYNATSVEFEIPMAAYNLNEIQGQIKLRFSTEGEEMVKIGEDEPEILKEGELVYGDDLGITCIDFNYRDSDRTKITEKVDRIIVFVDGHNDIPEEYIKNVLATVGGRLEKFTGGSVVGYGMEQ